MATKFFSDGAVHAYFNPYDTPYDAFMNYMNVLSDFEIRLQKLFPDTAEQDQIFKLGTQVIEKDMLIEKQVNEIEKLNKKLLKINPKVKPEVKKLSKSPVNTTAKKKPVKEVLASLKNSSTAPAKKTHTPVKSGKKVKAKKKKVE